MVKKLFLVHIPKTAGTTVNEVLSSHLLSKVHIEREPDWHSTLRTGVDEQFVSGHVTAPHALSLIDRADWFVFTFLRDPVEHLISHLKWAQYMGRYEHLHVFPTEVQDVCRYVSETDLNDISRLAGMLATFPKARVFFDNCQTRFLSGHREGEWIERRHLFDAMNVANNLDFVGSTENLINDLALLLRRAGLAIKIQTQRSNISPVSGRPDFSSQEVLGFYQGLVSVDSELHDSLIPVTSAVSTATPRA